MGSGRQSYDHGAVDTPLLYMTIGECLRRIAEQHPEKEALVSVHQDRRFTYGQFDRMTDQLAKGLLRLGVKKGDRVGIWAVNCWEWVAMQFATPKIGAVLVNINPAYRTHELRIRPRAVRDRDARPDALLQNLPILRDVVGALPRDPSFHARRTGRVGSARAQERGPDRRKEEGAFCFEDILEDGKKVPDEDTEGGLLPTGSG